MIEVPPKIWRPKVVNKYIPPDYANDIDECVFDFPQFGNTVYRPPSPWVDHDRTDLILFDTAVHKAELTKHIRLNTTISSDIQNRVIDIVKQYWDCFCADGAKRTILSYEFSVDTGNAKPVCCKKPQYGPYESNIIMKQVKTLIGNNWIERCEGPWGSSIVLAAKPHQEHILNIDDFIWYICVSYRRLNSITKPFEFPIPRCDDAIGSVGTGSSKIWIISLDARQGYHQVAVRQSDREKLAFFAPNNQKYTFRVMPFGPTNTLGFYSAMMKNFKGG